tara:strand:+ start:750 stop:2189 length:1440 start_codon:yes stop_codon:yes gene_type:complete
MAGRELQHNRKSFGTWRMFSYFVLIGAVAMLSGTLFRAFQDRLDLRDLNSEKVREFYTRLAESQVSFADTGDMVFPDEQKFLAQRSEYLRTKSDFIEIDLRTMKLTLYDKGRASTTVRVLSKGKDRSWWETPTGNYKVLGKSLNGYSSIGDVWMPYSIQFYGNYLVHGWPHYNDGTPVPQGYSGGCVRLSDESARIVYDFATQEMPVLVLEDEDQEHFGTLVAKPTNTSLPAISAKAFLVIDLASGETLLQKRAEEKLSIASLTKLMTGVVAHEVIYLGRSIKVAPQMLASISQVFSPVTGERYMGIDLLYPLLMQSSNHSAKVLASFIGEETFVQNMNAKAASLEMTDTQFADTSGISAGNISTAYDLTKLLQYIYYKRPFLFDITKGVAFENVGLLKIGETIPVDKLRNFNEFVNEPDLIGVKNGETTAARQTLATAWEMNTAQGKVPMGIIVLGSEDRKSDTGVLLQWVKDNFEVF